MRTRLHATSLPNVSAAAPASLRVIAERVEARIEIFLAAESARWSALDADLTEPMAEIGRLVLTGGKRLRPAFCLWGYVGLGGSADDVEALARGVERVTRIFG